MLKLIYLFILLLIPNLSFSRNVHHRNKLLQEDNKKLIQMLLENIQKPPTEGPEYDVNDEYEDYFAEIPDHYTNPHHQSIKKPLPPIQISKKDKDIRPPSKNPKVFQEFVDSGTGDTGYYSYEEPEINKYKKPKNGKVIKFKEMLDLAGDYGESKKHDDYHKYRPNKKYRNDNSYTHGNSYKNKRRPPYYKNNEYDSDISTPEKPYEGHTHSDEEFYGVPNNKHRYRDHKKYKSYQDKQMIHNSYHSKNKNTFKDAETKQNNFARSSESNSNLDNYGNEFDEKRDIPNKKQVTLPDSHSTTDEDLYDYKDIQMKPKELKPSNTSEDSSSTKSKESPVLSTLDQSDESDSFETSTQNISNYVQLIDTTQVTEFDSSSESSSKDYDSLSPTEGFNANENSYNTSENSDTIEYQYTTESSDGVTKTETTISDNNINESTKSPKDDSGTDSDIDEDDDDDDDEDDDNENKLSPIDKQTSPSQTKNDTLELMEDSSDSNDYEETTTTPEVATENILQLTDKEVTYPMNEKLYDENKIKDLGKLKYESKELKDNQKEKHDRAKLFLIFLNKCISNYENGKRKNSKDGSYDFDHSFNSNQLVPVNYKLHCIKDDCEFTVSNTQNTGSKDHVATSLNKVKSHLEEALLHLENGLNEYYSRIEPKNNNDKKYYRLHCEGTNCKYHEVPYEKSNFNENNKYMKKQNVLIELHCLGDYCDLKHEDLSSDQNNDFEAYATENYKNTNLFDPFTEKHSYFGNENIEILENLLHGIEGTIVKNLPENTYKLVCTAGQCVVESDDKSFVQHVEKLFKLMHSKHHGAKRTKEDQEHIENSIRTWAKVYDINEDNLPRMDEKYVDEFETEVIKLDGVIQGFEMAVANNMENRCPGPNCHQPYRYELICKNSFCKVESNDTQFLKDVEMHSNFIDETRSRNKHTRTKDKNAESDDEKEKIKAYHLEAYLSLIRQPIIDHIIWYINDSKLTDIRKLNLSLTQDIAERIEAIKENHQERPIDENMLYALVTKELRLLNDFPVKKHDLDSDVILVSKAMYDDLVQLEETQKLLEKYT